MVKNVTFLDGSGNLVKATIELKTKENNSKNPVKDWNLNVVTAPNYKTLSISGDYNGSYGQIYDSIKPATKDQERLVKLWREYHLNDMQAGTENQCKCVEQFQFVREGETLTHQDMQLHLAINSLETDNGYRWGHSWLLKPLPDKIEGEIEDIVQRISEEENSRKGGEVGELEKYFKA
ncbi:hypothetical protein, partial [Chryseobacterium artocarpi]|uniref:hypothetical protein n=1 Tax=Chryseobacterium artocarpi TaxID=1414727 RepID=UPI003F403326